MACDNLSGERFLPASANGAIGILNLLHENIFHCDPGMRILWANKAALKSSNMSLKELTGHRCWKIWGRRAGICDDCPVALAQKTGTPHSIEKVSSDGRFWIVQGAPAFDNQGRINGAFGAALETADPKKEKKAEEERTLLKTSLYQAQKMEAIGTLAGGVAHDFNNLLMGIQGRVSLMLADTGSKPQHREHLHGIEVCVRNAVDLTHQLLGFARGGKYETRTIDLNELVVKSVLLFGRTKKEIEIHRTLFADLWPVKADPGQIEQVLLNMYVNAWQAMPAGGALFIQTENIVVDAMYSLRYRVDSGKYVKVAITDTGVGMDKPTQKKIFEPFFTTKEMGRGTGLGLASSYGIVKNHHGFINVYSEIGKGSTFNIYLPASDGPLLKDEAKPEGIKAGEGTLLLVDDEEMILEVGKSMLETLGYTVLCANSGKKALALYRDHAARIDLVVLDMIMPELSGGETFDRLRKIDAGVKVLLSSGYSINGDANEILSRGCRGFLQKPFNLIQLSQKIREILDPAT